MERFVYGTQYLRGMTPRPEEWDTDMRRMKELGFNTIRAWLLWNVVEPTEGKLNREYLDRFMDLSGKHGLDVGLLLHLNAAPEWAVRKYSHYFYVSNTGEAFEPAPRSNTPSGGWPGFCYDWPEVRRVTGDFIARVVDHLAGRENIAFWEPMNEPHVIFDGKLHCYCEASRKKFVAWMKRKYGTLENVAAAWGRVHTAWEEIRPNTWDAGYTDAIDYRLFMEDNLVEELKRRNKIIAEHDSGRRPIIGHSYGSNVSREDLPGMAFDDWKNTELFDKWGYSAFPQSREDNMAVALGMVQTRCAAKGKEVWQSELGTGDNGVGIDRHRRVRREELAGWIWESIAQGAKGLLHWQYRKEAQGSEIGAFGLTEYDGRVAENGEETGRICRLLQKHAELFNHAEPAPAEVGIVFSKLSWMIEWCQIWRSELRTTKVSRDCLAGYFRMFWEDNIPADILHEDFVSLAELEKYRLVILPMPVGLSESFTGVLTEFIRKGGTVFSDPYFCAFDGKQWLDKKVPGRGFETIFGCEEKEIDSRSIRDIKLRYRRKTETIRASHHLETFRLSTGKPLANYTNGEPAIVTNRFGKGRAILSGLNLGLASAGLAEVSEESRKKEVSGDCRGAKKIVMDLAGDLNIRPVLQSNKPGITGNILHNKRGGDVLILLNHEDKSQVTQICLDPLYTSARCLETGQPVKIRQGKATISIKPLATRIFYLTF